MTRCPACETEYADHLDACPACAEDQEVHTCPRCREEYAGSDACPACGALRVPASCDVHPERRAAGRCVVCGRAVCRACRADEHRAVLCLDHRAVTVIEGWAQVYTTPGEFEARLMRDNLRAEGIDAQIFSQRDHMFSVEVGDLSIVRLLVPVWDFERARHLIHDHLDAGGELAFACPACGEASEPGARQCAACGAPLR